MSPASPRALPLLLAALCAVPVHAAADHANADPMLPPPPAGHPRVFLRAADIPVIAARRATPLLADAWAALEQRAAQPVPAPGDPVERQMDVSEAKALAGLLGRDAAACGAARDGIRALHGGYRIDEGKPDVTREIGRVVLATALVYDWCNASIDAAERRRWIDHVVALASHMEIHWPALVQGSVVGHGVEAQLARDMLAAGIAMYDEEPSIYRRVAGHILGQFKPARDDFYRAGFHHQGASYGPYRYQWDVFATVLFARMGYPDVFDRSLGTAPYRWLYTRRPDGQLLRDGDDYFERYRRFGVYWDLKGQDYAASYYRDGVLMGDALKQRLVGMDPLFDLLLVDPGVVPLAPDALPLARYFPEPLGAMTARTGWDAGLDADAVVADMKLGTVGFGNHQHLDAGSFQLYFKGPLAVNSGIYQGRESSYGGAHFLNYYQRTIAHNAMLVHDPAQRFTWNGQPLANDGGQFYPADGAEPATLDEVLAPARRRGAVRAHALGPDPRRPDFTYLEGELAPAYGPKVKAFQRAFVFLDFKQRQGARAALLVFDRVDAAAPGMRKTWLMHTVDEPRIDGNTVSVTRTGQGYHGELRLNALWPAADDLRIVKVGGPDKEFLVDGRQYPNSFPDARISADNPAWRIEIAPAAARAEDIFLNVLQVKDERDAMPVRAVARLDAGALVGAVLGDRAVLFGRAAAPVSAPVTLDMRSQPGPLNVLVTGLAHGGWTVTPLDGTAATVLDTQPEQGSLYFAAQPGRYRLAPR